MIIITAGTLIKDPCIPNGPFITAGNAMPNEVKNATT
jgi:hypothetical protein